VVQYACPVIGHMPVDAIGIADVLSVLKPKGVPPEETLWVRAPTTARRLRGRIEKILNRSYALLHANDPAKAKALEAANPAAWGDHLKHLLGNNGHEVEHFCALHYRDAHEFVAVLRADGSLAAKALEFTLLTASRSTQAVQARWDEVDFDNRTWTIPAARMKANRPHTVPLSDPAIAILREMEAIRTGDRVFVPLDTAQRRQSATCGSTPHDLFPSATSPKNPSPVSSVLDRSR
jgi:integrase